MAKAALIFAEAGSEREAVRIAMDLNTLLHDAETLHAAVCLLSRLQRVDLTSQAY